MILRGEVMDVLIRLNKAVEYIENHLDEDIDISNAARIACENEDGFKRIFRSLTGLTVNEYIRKRRLSLAVSDIHNGEKIIDVSIKYGFNSSDSFCRAFKKQHNTTPNVVRDLSVPVNIYPPVSFHINIKGAEKMNFKIVEKEETVVFGFLRKLDVMADNRWKDENAMWSEDADHIPEKICSGYDGIWYGIWNNGSYTIARNKKDVQSDKAEMHIIPAGKYAVFTTEKGGYAGDELPKLRDLIFNSWLPGSEYRQKSDFELEVYHLWTNRTERREKRYYEIWVPVENK